MKRLLALLIVLSSLFSCSSYSVPFVELYSCEDCYHVNEAILVFPSGKKYCFVANDIVRQIIYPKYRIDYPNYELFLKELFRGKLCVEAGTISRIERYDLAPPFIVNRIIKKYLLWDESYLEFRFKQRLKKEKEMGIVKMMFDNGYYVLWDDFSAEYLFLQPQIGDENPTNN